MYLCMVFSKSECATACSNPSPNPWPPSGRDTPTVVVVVVVHEFEKRSNVSGRIFSYARLHSWLKLHQSQLHHRCAFRGHVYVLKHHRKTHLRWFLTALLLACGCSRSCSLPQYPLPLPVYAHFALEFVLRGAVWSCVQFICFCFFSPQAAASAPAPAGEKRGYALTRSFTPGTGQSSSTAPPPPPARCVHEALAPTPRAQLGSKHVAEGSGCIAHLRQSSPRARVLPSLSAQARCAPLRGGPPPRCCGGFGALG